MRVPTVLAIAMLLMGCGHDVPEHDVVVTSNCNGPDRSARFEFDAIDFETSCSGEGLMGTCSTNHGSGRKVSGDLEVLRLILTGLEEFGPERYELDLPQPETVTEGDAPARSTPIWCGWYVNESLEPTEGKRPSCFHSAAPCWAELDVKL